MTQRELKVRAGWTIIISNAIILALEIFYVAMGWISPDQFTTIIAITSPIFACYALSVARYFWKNKSFLKDENTEKADTSYMILSFAVPIAYAFFIASTITSQASGHGIFDNFEDFKRGLMYAEIVFSGYAGYTMNELFPKTESD